MSARDNSVLPSSAAEWYLRIREGEIDSATDLAFSEWMKDEAHQRSFEEVELAWTLAEEVRSESSIQSLLATAVPRAAEEVLVRDRILLVEDHAQLRKVLSKTLTQSGYRVTAAESGDAAMTLLQGGLQIDILLSDIRMPGRLDGVQLAEWLRDARPSTVILLQTGFADINTGHFPLLRKPFMPTELIATLQSVVGAKQ